MEIQRHRFRHNLFYTVLLWLPLCAVAQQHDNLDVEELARKVWSEENFIVKKRKYKSTPLVMDSNTYYVVVKTDEAGKDSLPGYMLVADNDGTPTLLAFDDKSKFSPKNLPPHIESWIKGYERMVSNTCDARDELAKWMRASETGNEDVAPLLGNREWGQDNPYNLLCPTINGKHCPTGCVATALSQIMSYHQWPVSGIGSSTYTTASQKIEVSFDFSNNVFEWGKLLDSYIPYEDLTSFNESIISNNLYSLNTIGIDDNSIPLSKCYISISGLTVMGKSSFEGEVVLIATDANGNFESKASSTASVASRSSGRILSNKSFLLYIPSGLADGEYRLFCAVRSNDTSEWSLSNARGRDNYLVFLKEGNTFSINGEKYPCCPTSEDVLQVSNILQAVGAAVKMDYNLGSSGSNDENTAEGLVKYLKYDSDLTFAYPDTYTDEQWHETLQQELMEGRPVYYTGQGLESGHAFVIDGFKKAEDGTTYYHVNWGWDGLCNGYYLLNMLRPSSTGTGGSSGSNYASQPSMLIGMKPEDGISTTKLNCSSIDLLKSEYSVGDFLPTRIRTLAMQTANDFTGSLSIELHNEDNETEPIELYKSTLTITSKRGLTNYYASCQIPTDIPGGNYMLRISCTDNDNNKIDIQCKEWPRITIKGINEWTGGSQTQSLKKLAIGSNVDIQYNEANSFITLKIDSIVNPMPKLSNGVLSVIITDKDGRMLSVASETIPISVSGYSVRKNISISTQISRYMPDENYRLQIAFLPQNDSLWTYCDRMDKKGEIWWAVFSHEYIPISVAGGNINVAGYGSFKGADIPWVSNVHSIARERNVQEAIYDLYGRRIKCGQKGIYIIRRDNQSIKFIK